jgi:hypothetical protein
VFIVRSGRCARGGAHNQSLWERRHKGDLIGKSAAQSRALHFQRDRDYLRSDLD